MKITVQVTQSELDEMEFDSVSDFGPRMQAQIMDGVVGDAGEAGADWLVNFDLDVVVVDQR